MSENDFYKDENSQYRGSNYDTYGAPAVSTQGNVSSALTENRTNSVTTPAQSFIPSSAVSSNLSGALNDSYSAQSKANKQTNPVLGGSAGEAVSSALPTIGQSAGSTIGTNIALGAENVFSGVGSDALSKLSGGLIGSSVPNVSGISSALSGASNSTAAGALNGSLSKVSSASSLGGSIGSGIASAAVSLLTGGSVKDAAFSGVGAALGQAFIPIPVVGGFIGSTIGSLLGGMFGGGLQRQTLSAQLRPDSEGKLSVSSVGGKNTSSSDSRTYGQRVADVLNAAGEQYGLKFTQAVSSETNIGKKDKKTTYRQGPWYSGGKEYTISSTPYDVESLALSVLGNKKAYTFKDSGGDSVLQSRIPALARSSKTFAQLGKNIDTFNTSRGLIGGNLPYTKQQNRYSFGV